MKISKGMKKGKEGKMRSLTLSKGNLENKFKETEKQERNSKKRTWRKNLRKH